MKSVMIIHFLVDGKTTFQLASFCFEKTKVRGEPGSRMGERNSPGFCGSKRVQHFMEVVIVVSDQFSCS